MITISNELVLHSAINEKLPVTMNGKNGSSICQPLGPQPSQFIDKRGIGDNKTRGSLTLVPRAGPFQGRIIHILSSLFLLKLMDWTTLRSCSDECLKFTENFPCGLDLVFGI